MTDFNIGDARLVWNEKKLFIQHQDGSGSKEVDLAKAKMKPHHPLPQQGIALQFKDGTTGRVYTDSSYAYLHDGKRVNSQYRRPAVAKAAPDLVTEVANINDVTLVWEKNVKEKTINLLAEDVASFGGTEAVASTGQGALAGLPGNPLAGQIVCPLADS